MSVALIVPSVFLAVPQKVYAQGEPVAVPTAGVGVNDSVTSFESTISAVKSSLSWALDVTNTAASYAQQVNTYVLQPLAFVLSGNLMKALTAGVISFVIGKANGTGAPQFVVDVAKSMQIVADGRALAYLRQINQTHSPFSSSIRSALSADYLSKTSLAGFWAANMNTLARSSPNVPAYLAGNWSQGGVAAWFALTTQVQNNPYTFYNNSRDQLASYIGPGIGGVTGARAQELSWGSGFMSWCKENPAAVQVQKDADAEWDACKASGGTDEVCRDRFEAMGGYRAVSSQGVNPGDACTNDDGTPGTIQTPGSTIKATLDKVLGGQQDQIVRMGNVGPQINQILSNIGTVMQTVNFASQVLGGGNTGGLLAVNSTSGTSAASRLAQFAPMQNSSGNFTTGYLGATQSSINTTAAEGEAFVAANAAAGASEAASAASGPVTFDTSLTSRVAQYESAWNTITTAADTASSSIMSLVSFCTAAADSALVSGAGPTFMNIATAQAVAARTAFTTKIVPVFVQIATASTTILTARLAIQNNATPTSVDTQVSQLSMSPTMSDVTYAQQNAQVFGGARANPAGSFAISGGTLIDQMNLISSNADALKASVCTPPLPEFISL